MKTILIILGILGLFGVVLFIIGSLGTIFQPQLANIIYLNGRATETWQNGLIVTPQDAVVGDYTIHVEKNDRTQSFTCNPNTCGGTFVSKDQYGCDTWSYYQSAQYRCTSERCEANWCQRGWCKCDQGIIPVGASYGETQPTNCGSSGISYESGGQSTCGGAIVTEQWGCAFKYSISKNGAIIDSYTTQFRAAGVLKTYNDVEFQLFDTQRFVNSECQWSQSTIKIKIPSTAFDFKITPTKQSFIQGEIAYVEVGVKNMWKSIDGTLKLKVCQPTFSGESCDTSTQEVNIPYNPSGYSVFNLQIPTNFVVEKLSIIPLVELKLKPESFPLTNVNVDCVRKDGRGKDGTIDNINDCAYIEAGVFTGDKVDVLINPKPVFVDRDCNTGITCDSGYDCKQTLSGKWGCLRTDKVGCINNPGTCLNNEKCDTSRLSQGICVATITLPPEPFISDWMWQLIGGVGIMIILSAFILVVYRKTR